MQKWALHLTGNKYRSLNTGLVHFSRVLHTICTTSSKSGTFGSILGVSHEADLIFRHTDLRYNFTMAFGSFMKNHYSKKTLNLMVISPHPHEF